MSLWRFVYYNSVAGGWAAFLAWVLAQMFVLSRGTEPTLLQTTMTFALVGAAVGGGLNLVSGMANAQWWELTKRVAFGLIGGGVGGFVGGFVADVLYDKMGWLCPRALGWMLMGLAIGASEGVYLRSPARMWHGLIGGGVGGLVGGVLFDWVFSVRSSLMSSQATALVILGVALGALIGLTHVILKKAWLTVLDGFRPGRQLILTSTVTVLGRGDHLPLPFLGHANQDLESEHLRIVRDPDGQYHVEDNHSRLGTRVNSLPIQGPVPLRDGDLIKLGTNIVRFNHRKRSAAAPASSPTPAGANLGKMAPPPPPGTVRPPVAPPKLGNPPVGNMPVTPVAPVTPPVARPVVSGLPPPPPPPPILPPPPPPPPKGPSR